MPLSTRVLLVAILGLSVPKVANAQTKKLDDWLESTLNSALAVAAPDNAREDPLDLYPFSFVFLINTAQATNKTAYAVFVRQGIEGFLKRRWAADSSRPENDRPTFSIYPYQLDLYRESGEIPLTESYSHIFEQVPISTRFVRPNGSPYNVGDGSLNVSALAESVEGGGKNRNRPIVIIQVSTNPLSEVKGNPHVADDEPARKTSILSAAGLTEYPEPGLPLLTDPPRKGESGYNVDVWLYGPRTLEPYRMLKATPKGSIWILVGGAFAAALAAIAGFFTLRLASRGAGLSSRRASISIKLGDGLPYTPGKEEVVKVFGKNPEPGGLLLKGVIGADEDDGPLFQFRAVKGGVEFTSIQWRIDVSHGSSAPVLSARDTEITFTGIDGLKRRVSLKIT